MNEKPTFNQINEQSSSAYMNGSNADPTVLVKRSDGRITVGRLDTEARDVHFSENGQELVKPSVSMEAFSDERQAQLAAELAGVALRHDVAEGGIHVDATHEPEESVEAFGDMSGVSETPFNPEDAAVLPVEEFNVDEALLRRGYRDAMEEKARAQREGRGDDSIYWGQQAGQYARSLRDNKSI